MSMLAEKRRKQKWSLNPRGKAWSEDNSKFGQKLLEKMGWSHGKGLGAKEDGMVDHVKVAYKNDSQGIGYKDKDDQWTEHETNFTALLSSLRGEEPEEEIETKLTSLEEKSQSSKYRVHYKKFTRGKDLSKCSEKDLASIFGKKSISELKKTQLRKESANEEGIKENAVSNKLFSNAGLISDYFKKKLPNFGKVNGYLVGNNGVLKSEGTASDSETDHRPAFSRSQDSEESESEARIGLGFSHDNVESNNKSKKPSFISYVNGNHFETENTTKKKKKNKKRPLEETEETSNIPPAKKKKLEPQEQSQEVVEKKKKKKKLSNEHEEVGLSNPAFDPLHTPVKMEKHILEPIEEKLDESINVSAEVVESTFQTEVQINNESTPKKRSLEFIEEEEVVKKKKKKKNKKEAGEDNTSIMNGNEDANSSVQSKEKRKKKSTKETTSSIDDNEDITTTSHEEVNGAAQLETGKKKKKARKEINSSMGEIEDIAISFETVNNSIQLEQKKKKKAKADTLNGVCLDTIDLSNTSEDDQQNGVFLGTIDLTKKKKKSKKSSSTEVCPVSENSEEVISTKTSKKTKTSGNFGVDNPCLNLSVEDELPETKTKTKKKSKRDKDVYAAENPVFNGEDTVDIQDLKNEEFELKRKDKSKKKHKNKSTTAGLDNPALNLTDTTEEQEAEETLELMFNVVSTPVVAKAPQMFPLEEEPASIRAVKSVSRRKSVHFNDVTRERIIPNGKEVQDEPFDESIVEVEGKLNDSAQLNYIRKAKKKTNKGLINQAFDQLTNALEEDLTSISKTFDQFQAEVENDINEGKERTTLALDDIMVGEVGNPEGDNERLRDGSVKLKFKHANFKKSSAKYMESYTGPKKTYKHLIKGDIIVDFKETNLHEINGYAFTKAT